MLRHGASNPVAGTALVLVFVLALLPGAGQPEPASPTRDEHPIPGSLFSFEEREITSEVSPRQLKARIGRPRGLAVHVATREPGESRFWARLPDGWTDGERCGLLVWCDPTDRGQPPRHYFAAADELRLILIGVEGAGNERKPWTDRVLLALDAIAIARVRWAIDDTRVYVSGMSGGGRISSILWGVFPDVITGAVPIVGMNSYRVLERGTPGTFWPAGYKRPRGKAERLLRTRRLGAITGTDDFNHEQTMAYIDAMKRDGMAVRAFTVEGMGHTMPPPEVLTEALRWIDDPNRAETVEPAQGEE
ncbi:MAG: hypothetical protein AAGG07_04150 [Planctomycetota bacterium]